MCKGPVSECSIYGILVTFSSSDSDFDISILNSVLSASWAEFKCSDWSRVPQSFWPNPKLNVEPRAKSKHPSYIHIYICFCFFTLYIFGLHGNPGLEHGYDLNLTGCEWPNKSNKNVLIMSGFGFGNGKWHMIYVFIFCFISVCIEHCLYGHLHTIHVCNQGKEASCNHGNNFLTG